MNPVPLAPEAPRALQVARPSHSAVTAINHHLSSINFPNGIGFTHVTLTTHVKEQSSIPTLAGIEPGPWSTLDLGRWALDSPISPDHYHDRAR